MMSKALETVFWRLRNEQRIQTHNMQLALNVIITLVKCMTPETPMRLSLKNVCKHVDSVHFLQILEDCKVDFCRVQLNGVTHSIIIRHPDSQ